MVVVVVVVGGIVLVLVLVVVVVITIIAAMVILQEMASPKCSAVAAKLLSSVVDLGASKCFHQVHSNARKRRGTSR